MSFNFASNTITKNTAGTANIGHLDTGPGTGVVGADAFVYGDDIGLQLEEGAWKVTVSGTVLGGIDGASVGTDYGIYLVDTSTTWLSTITLGTEASVGGLDVGILANHATSITNSGVIGGGVDGIRETGAGNFTIANKTTDSVIAGEVGIGIWLDDTATGTHTITNAGEIFGGGTAIKSDAAAAVDKVTNSGSIEGDVLLGGGDDTFTNSGTVLGGVDLGAGADMFSNSGTVTGNLVLGDGDNSATNNKTITGNVTAGIGNDKLTVGGGGLITGVVDLGAGTNTLTVGGGAQITGAVTLGGGTSTASVSGTLGATLTAGGGNDKLTVGSGGKITGEVDLGDGLNTVANSGKLGNVKLGGGNDTVTNNNLIEGTLTLGAGLNTVTNNKTINLDVVGGGGNDTVTNKGTIGGDVDLGAGSNKVTNSGKILGGVLTGGADDTYVGSALNGAGLLVNGSVTGTIQLGDGADKVTGGALAEIVSDGNGGDTYKLGGGNDTYIATGASGTDGTDIIDGGAGLADLYDAGTATQPVFANFDAVNHTAGSVTVNANTAFGLGVSGTDTQPDGGTIRDTITGFENFLGGTGNDVAFGNASANALSGNDGDDTLYGFAGADTLDGGDGADTLVGGAGKDVLRAGTGDGDIDTFVYLALSDSGTTFATRDIIEGFEDANDIIDLSTMGDTLAMTFNFVGMNEAFTGLSGAVRGMWVAGFTLVQLDINGDSAVDFSVALEGQLTLGSANFVF